MCCRILIVDWDVHHGQATQQQFYNDKRYPHVTIAFAFFIHLFLNWWDFNFLILIVKILLFLSCVEVVIFAFLWIKSLKTDVLVVLSFCLLLNPVICLWQDFLTMLFIESVCLARVLYFSIHRYQHGHYWPNLRESDYDYIGEGEGRGYNINVPLNKVTTNAQSSTVKLELRIWWLKVE